MISGHYKARWAKFKRYGEPLALRHFLSTLPLAGAGPLLEPDVAIAERLAKVAPARRITFAEWLISLNPEDRKALETACHPDSGYTNVQLLDIIIAEGGPASKDALAGYRKTLA